MSERRVSGRRGSRSDNRGMTLIELIVVITIMAIAGGILWMGITYVFSLEAKQCAHDVNSLMSKSRIAAMTKAGENYLRIYMDDTGVWVEYTENDVTTPQQVGTARLRVEYVTEGDPDDLQPLGDAGIVIAFNSDGSFSSIGASDDYYTEIIVSSNGSRTIEMVPYTGHHQVR